MLCELFGYTKQAYYKQFTHQCNRTKQRQLLQAAVLTIRRQLPRLGTRKLHFLLKSANTMIGRDRLFELLRAEGMLISKRKKYTVTTDSKHWMRKYPNRIKELVLSRPEQVWVADITYIDTIDGNAYLHLITDAYSKQIMGYELCSNMEAVSTLKALIMALTNRQYKDQSLIHHSDRGLQYCSKVYIDTLVKNNITISMTESGSPYDNAVAERMNGILKDEFGLGEKLNGLEEVKVHTEQSIRIYNLLRPHLSCQMLTPKQMHQQQNIKVKTYKKTLNTSVGV
jgi:transposase InsO family protein